jgi:MGT family glycosyltransferase
MTEAKHIAGFCETSASHIKNMAAIGRELMRRGHRFTLFHYPQMEREITKQEITFAPLWMPDSQSVSEGAIPYPIDSDQMGVSLKNFLSFAKESARLVCENAPDALRTSKVDAVLVDMSQPAAATVAEHLKLPYITICLALPLHRTDTVPPDFLPWRYESAWWAKQRNRLAYRLRDFMIRPLNQVLNRYRKQWGLPEYGKPEDSFSPYAQLTQLVAEFDFPRTNLPACFHYVGPYRRSAYNEAAVPINRFDGRPLIYASLGTCQGNRTGVWEAIAKACAELDLQLIISLAGAPVPPELNELPGHPLVVDQIPQIEVISHAAAVITHAGLNTVMEALAAGVPMVAIPITGDQFGVAARLEYFGAGKVIGLKQCRGDVVKKALTDVLSDPTYRQRASDLKHAVERTRGAEAAADIVVEAMLTRRAVLARDLRPAVHAG